MSEPDEESQFDDRQLQAVLRAIGREVDQALSDGAARCGPYTLMTVLGEGGSGIVYAAVQDQPVSRRVAIKILKRGLDTHEVLRRFALEEHALGRINHQAVVTILESGITADGRPWFAMPLFDGDPITTACDEQKLGIAERLALFADVCDGVHAAHVQGIVHRDLKPGNIVAVKDSQSKLSAHIIDFGIAKALEQSPSQTLVSDRPNLGTPAYMAPEQSGGWGEADVRTDVFSLGVVLGEIMNGLRPTAPKDGTDGRERAHFRPLISRALVAAVAQGSADGSDIARARGCALSGLLHRLRGDIDAVVSKATMQEPHLRYQSADAFAADIRRIIAHQPISARAPSLRYVLGRVVRRHRFAVALGGVALSTVLGLVVFAAVKVREVAHQTQRVSIQAKRSQDISDILRGVFNGIDPAMIRGRDPELLKSILAVTVDDLVEQLPQRDLVSTARVSETLAKALIDLEDPERAITLLDSVDAAIVARADEAIDPLAHDELMVEHARVQASLGDAWAVQDAIRRGFVPAKSEHPQAHAAWREALDALESLPTSGLDADSTSRIALRSAIGLWRNQVAWPAKRDLAEFEGWIAERVNELDDNDVLKWDFLLRRAEINPWEPVLRDYPPLVEGLAKALGPEHPRVIKARVRYLSFLVGAGVESRSNPDSGNTPFTDAQLRQHWVDTAALGEETVLLAQRVLGAENRVALIATLWHLQAVGYSQGTESVHERFAALRAEFASRDGADSENVKQVDGAIKGVEQGERFGRWWN